MDQASRPRARRIVYGGASRSLAAGLLGSREGDQFLFQGGVGRLDQYTAIREENRWDTLRAMIQLADDRRRIGVFFNIDIRVWDLHRVEEFA